MRALKTFMRNRKAEMLWCGPCECRTLQCWRYANENCGCGEWGSSLPPLHNIIDATSERSGDVLTDGEGNFVNITIETDPETGDDKPIVISYWIFEDERYIVDGINLWQEMFEAMDLENIRIMIEYYTEFPSDVFEAMEAYYENPTEANYEVAHEALTSWIPEE